MLTYVTVLNPSGEKIKSLLWKCNLNAKHYPEKNSTCTHFLLPFVECPQRHFKKGCHYPSNSLEFTPKFIDDLEIGQLGIYFREHYEKFDRGDYKKKMLKNDDARSVRKNCKIWDIFMFIWITQGALRDPPCQWAQNINQQH